VSGRLLVPLLGLRPGATSSVVYVRNVIPPLAEEWGPDDVTVLCDAHGRRVIEGYRGRVERHEVPDRRILRLLALRRHLPRAERALKPAVIFVPEGHVVATRTRAPIVFALHSHLNFSRPQGQPWGRRLYWTLWHDRDVRRHAARAAALIAPTTVFAEEFEAHVPQARGKIVVVHHGVSRAFRAALPEERRPTGAPPHVLCVGNVHAYKNVAGALRIFERAAEGLPHELRVAGVSDGELRALMSAAGVGAGLARRVRSLGILGESKLAEQYRSAAALLFPSIVESFGLPVVEAMASGCPVACSDLATLREVTAGAAALAPPEDEPALAAALREILTDDAHAAALRTAGLERAKAFSWKENARQVARILREAAANSIT
jgi:glycosyltransferase involved in cell wall biosynthesis